MVTFSQFCDEVTQFLGEPVNCRNWTTEKDCGHTLNLYEAQTCNGCTAIEYTQGLDWAFRFNGHSGIGRTLEGAYADHSVRYSDYLNQERCLTTTFNHNHKPMATLLHPKTKQEIDFGSLSPSEVDDLYDECKQISQHLAFKIRTAMELNQEVPRKQEDLKAYADRILMRLESLREDRTLEALFIKSLAVLTPTQRSLVKAEYSRLRNAREH